jgi:hypothetical protein
MILGYLVLAHLLGDFVFQPSKLVIWKISSKWGILVHCIVHFILLALLFAPFLLSGDLHFLTAILFVTACHFFIDNAKISYDLRHNNKVGPFLIDQLLHFIAIALAASFLEKSTPAAPSLNYLTVFLCSVIIVGPVVEVFRYQKMRSRNAKAKFQPNVRNMFTRLVIFTLIYGALIFLTPYL